MKLKLFFLISLFHCFSFSLDKDTSGNNKGISRIKQWYFFFSKCDIKCLNIRKIQSNVCDQITDLNAKIECEKSVEQYYLQCLEKCKKK